MGTRLLKFLMIVLLTGCVAWASAIFFGPWALKKYLEGQAGDAVEVTGLRVTPKLVVTASRVRMSDGGVVTASLRGVEVDWRLLTGDKPAVFISVANGSVVGSVSIEDLQVTVTQAENGDLLKISGKAARAGIPNAGSAIDVKFEANTDYRLQTLFRVMATTGSLTTQYPTNATASTSQIEVYQVDLGSNLLQQQLSGALALKSLVSSGPDLSMPEADIKFALAGGLLNLSLGARDVLLEPVGVAVNSLVGSMDYDVARSRMAGPINVALNDFVWGDIRLPSANAKIIPGDEQFKVAVEGTSLGSEITLGRRYIGRLPDASFAAKFDASSLGVNLQITGHVRLAAAQQPVELELSFQGTVADVHKPMACTEIVCEVSDVIYDYNLNVVGETLNGISRCLEPTCSFGGRAHELSTTNTNKFFANLKDVNLINPLVLGGAYAQMLQGIAVGAGHKINF